MYKPTHKTKIMGIMNMTTDSFSGDGLLTKSQDLSAFLAKLDHYIAYKVDIIDVGGESTRPGAAAPVSLQDELDRVLPAIRLIRERYDGPISVDTFKAEVARQAIAAGATMINDVSGMMMDPEMVNVARESELPIILVHSRLTQASCQMDHQDSKPTGYNEKIVDTVIGDLENLTVYAISRGLKRGQIILDPGIGFGKTAQENLALIKNLHRICALGYPVLLGVSRKSFIGHTTGAPVEQRLAGSIAAATVGLLNGADIIRVHDIAETHQAVQIIDAMKNLS